MSDSRIPTICPKCGHSVKFWQDHKGHMVTLPCDDPRLQPDQRREAGRE